MASLALSALEISPTAGLALFEPVSQEWSGQADFSFQDDIYIASRNYPTSSRSTSLEAVKLAVYIAAVEVGANFFPHIFLATTIHPQVNETFGVSCRKQPKEFVFSYGVPELNISAIKKDRFNSMWLQEAIDFIAIGEEDAALRNIAVGTTNAKEDREKIEFLSRDLDKLNLSILPNIILVSILRNIYSFRSKIPCWLSMLDKIEKILLERDQPARKLLRGLRS